MDWYTCTNSGYNDIGDEAAKLIATLPLLVKLYISTYGDNLGGTKITQEGLLTLCQLKLTDLGIGDNNYGDEGAFIVARHLPDL
mgnify:FL=1